MKNRIDSDFYITPSCFVFNSAEYSQVPNKQTLQNTYDKKHADILTKMVKLTYLGYLKNKQVGNLTINQIFSIYLWKMVNIAKKISEHDGISVSQMT